MSKHIFTNHKSHLKNYAFWSTVDEELYDVTKYDEMLCKRNVRSKQTCHDYLCQDIEYILKNLQENPRLIHYTKTLHQKLKVVRKDDINKMFWTELAPRLIKINYEQPVAEAELMVVGIKKAADIIDATTKKRPHTLAIETRSKKQQKIKEREMKEQVEYDELFLEDDHVSVGTIIKRKALELFQESNTRKLDVRERKIMTNGLSSILDLVDGSDSSQKSLFTEASWSYLMDLFQSEFALELVPMPSDIANIWIIISKSIVLSKRITLGIDYIYKIRCRQNDQNKRYLRIFEHILDLVETYPHMLVKKANKDSDYSESDILRIIWSPLLEQLFPPKHHNLTVKTGETISVISQEHKEDLYGDDTCVRAFKIDVRVVFKNSGKEIDLVSGELAKNDADMKIIADEGKISRETKDAVDSILSLVHTPAHSFGIQISGGSCVITSQTLSRNGLYVHLPVYSFSLPSCISELDSFINTLQKLISLQQHVIGTAHLLQQATNKKQSLDKSFGQREECSDETDFLHWRRDTFYTPPRNKDSKLPLYMFGSPSETLISRLLRAKHSEGDEGITYDEFGWGQKGDKWHNKITNETMDENPYA